MRLRWWNNLSSRLKKFDLTICLFSSKRRSLDEVTLDSLIALVESGRLTLQSSQAGLSIPKINRFCNEMRNGAQFPSISVNNGVIIEGHHRYVASVIVEVPLGTVPANRTIATIETEWRTVFFSAEDWDNPQPYIIGPEDSIA